MIFLPLVLQLKTVWKIQGVKRIWTWKGSDRKEIKGKVTCRPCRSAGLRYLNCIGKKMKRRLMVVTKSIKRFKKTGREFSEKYFLDSYGQVTYVGISVRLRDLGFDAYFQNTPHLILDTLILWVNAASKSLSIFLDDPVHVWWCTEDVRKCLRFALLVQNFHDFFTCVYKIVLIRPRGHWGLLPARPSPHPQTGFRR